jgi:hypothetical protein
MRASERAALLEQSRIDYNNNNDNHGMQPMQKMR